MPKSLRSRNGMGSVRQRSDGRFEARYTGADGKQHSIYGQTATEVTKKLRAATSSVDDGNWLEPSHMTVAEWLDIWYRDYCVGLRPSTMTNYRIRSDHIKASIGSIRMQSLTTTHIMRVISDCTNKGLSPVSVNNIQLCMTSAFNRAVEAKVISENPAKNVRLKSKVSAKEMHIIDRPQFGAFIAAAKKTRYANELITFLLTGMRCGELMGLTWSNVDFEKGELNVCQQLTFNNGIYRISPTKTGDSRRIKLPPEAIAVFRAQKVKQAEQRLNASHLWQPDEISKDLVFTKSNGTHETNVMLWQVVRHVGEEIGVIGLHPHDLRHSYAVAALRSGVDVKTVQHNLGHSSAAMTLDVYARYTDDSGNVAAKLMSAYFSEAFTK